MVNRILTRQAFWELISPSTVQRIVQIVVMEKGRESRAAATRAQGS
jgi:hypothetical protein